MAPFHMMPWWLATFAITFGLAALACAGHILVKRTFASADFIEHNEVAGFIIAIVGVLYAVLLAFTTVAVWEQYSTAEDRATQEVDAATDVLRFSGPLNFRDEQRFRTDLEHFTQAIITDEWPKMQVGQSSAAAQEYVEHLFDDVGTMRVRNLRESNLQNRLLERLQTLADLRRRRVNNNQSGIPGVLWAALLLGAATVIGFEYLFGMRNFKAQLLMTAATAIVIGLSFSVIIKLDYPFRGDVSVSPERWVALHDEIVRGR